MNNKNTMKNIHILATSNASKLGSHNGVLEYAPSFGFDLFDKNKNFRHNPVHIYITNNFEIEDGDLCIYDHNDTLILKKENVDKYGIIRLNNIGYQLNYCEKIILTTDEALIKQGVQKIEEDFLQWLIENPNSEFVEVKDIYLTKKKAAEDLKEKADKKAFEQKILGLIAEKQEDSLRGKSIEELQAMLNK